MIRHNELKTIRDFIRFATSRFNEAGLFFGHGTDNAWDEAIALVFHTLHLPHDIDQSILDANLTEEEQIKLTELIETRVLKRIPLAYLNHEAWFAGLSFYVDERVLIPRSPLAELIENRFEPWISSNDVKHVLDLCTGSGCIAIACAYALPDAEIDASDISHDSLAVARINVLRHSMQNRVHLYESDLFDALPKKKYDIIISNPPYVSQEEMDSLPLEYSHEPKLGLSADDGLTFVTRILQRANEYLNPKGVLIVEVGNSEFALAQAYPEIPFTWLEFHRGGGGVFLLTAQQLSFASFGMKSPTI